MGIDEEFWLAFLNASELSPEERRETLRRNASLINRAQAQLDAINAALTAKDPARAARLRQESEREDADLDRALEALATRASIAAKEPDERA
jgi:hypothetical protein